MIDSYIMVGPGDVELERFRIEEIEIISESQPQADVL